MQDFFKTKDSLDTSDSNTLSFELKKIVNGNKEEPTAYSNIKIDDINALELPILYYKFVEDVKTIDEGEDTYRTMSPEKAESPEAKKKLEAAGKKEPAKTPAVAKKPENKNLMELDFLTSESVDLYKLLAKRPPFTFKMYKSPTGKTGDETVCELPVLFFWIRKPPDTVYSKTTNTKGMRSIIQEYTSIDMGHMSRREIEYMLKDRGGKTILDQACSPIPIIPPRPPSSPVGGRRASVKSKSTVDKSGEIKVDSSINMDELIEQQENLQYLND
jgi:hypothetical protein